MPEPHQKLSSIHCNWCRPFHHRSPCNQLADHSVSIICGAACRVGTHHMHSWTRRGHLETDSTQFHNVRASVFLKALKVENDRGANLVLHERPEQ